VKAWPSDSWDEPDPSRITSRHDFKTELTVARERAGLTVRAVARIAGLPEGTTGGYFGGAHLPENQDRLTRILRGCGITEPAAVEQWCQAWRRVHRGGGESPGPSTTEAPAPGPVTPDPTAIRSTLVSTRPPVDRLPRDRPVRGRDELLEYLADRVGGSAAHQRPPTVLVLHGLGGVGKSTAALALARLALARGVQTWWISAPDSSVFLAGIRALGVELGLDPAVLRFGSPPDLLWSRLLTRPGPWVLFIDNVDNPPVTLAVADGQVTDGTGWLRPVTSGRGTVIVTTRDGSPYTWADPPPAWLKLIRVDGLAPAAGGQVLRDLAGDSAGPEPAAVSLAERLGGLPLGLALAGRYLAEAAHIPAAFADRGTPRTFAGYADALVGGGHRELLGTGPPTDRPARNLLESTWELSLDLVAARGTPVARPLLRLLACFEPAGLPYRLLSPEILARSGRFAGLDGRSLWQALRALADLGLIETSDRPDPAGGPEITLHPLVRGAARFHPEVREHIDDYLPLVAELVGQAATDLDPKHPADWPRWQAVADHCESPFRLARDHHLPRTAMPSSVVTALVRAAGYLRASGQLGRAAAVLTITEQAGRRLLGDEHPDVLALRHDLSRVWYDQGRLRDAGARFRVVLQARTRVLGAEHPDTLTTAHYLARVLRDDGKLPAAERLFRSTREARERVLGGQHPDTLTSRNNIGEVLLAHGELDQAEAELSEVYAQRSRLLGPEHPATLVTVHHLARLAHHRGQLGQAADRLAALVQTCRRVLGEHHPRTLTARQSLVEVYHDQGRLAEAHGIARDLAAARSASLGGRHPATLRSRHRLGLILVDRGELAVAETELRNVLSLCQLVLGSRHPDTGRARADLDELRRKRGGHADLG
jgi:hypothetical protein